MKISVIIPAKDEEPTIKTVVQSVKPYCDETIVVDGNSTDRTKDAALEAGARVLEDNGRGKGYAMRVGARSAKGEILVFIDADGSHNADDIPKLVAPIINRTADLVIGSRILGGSDEAFSNIENVFRMLGGFFLSYIIRKFYGIQLTDCLCGFKAIKRETFFSLDLQRNDFVIEEEIVIKLLKKGGRILEIPSHEFARTTGKSKLKTREGWKFILYLFKLLI